MRRAEKPVSRRSAKKTLSESAAYKKRLTEIAVVAIAVVVAVAGLPIVKGTGVDETGAGEGAGQRPGRLNAVCRSSLKTSKLTMRRHWRSCYRKVSR